MFLDYDDEYNYGVYKIMKLTTPYNIYISKLSSGSRYSAQGIEIAFYYFKYIGIILHAILRAFFEALLVNLLIKYVFSCKFIETIIIARFINIFHSIFTQGDLYTLFSKTSIITLIILLFIVFINSTFKRKNLKTRNYNTYLKESNYE